MHRIILSMMFCLVFLPACLRMPAGVAPSNVPLRDQPYEELERVTADDHSIKLFGFIRLGPQNRLDEALRKAQESKDGDALINITVEYRWHWYLLFTKDTTTVTATPIRFIRDPVRPAIRKPPPKKDPNEGMEDVEFLESDS